ncbi:MAG: UDP-N-acetylmuramate dehydrogenase [Oscillospiraceae bacterium]|jgi:UDP-N-acetylmuramate dehydrogenase|nr:UDP-N-acetylmuramate dehydrogenase [Oscillospiraceae bacterium]
MSKLESLAKGLENEGIALERDAKLSALTTFRVGGPCDLLVSPRREDELRRALRLIRESELPFAVIGRGSNVLFPDDGFRGAVIRIAGGFSGIRDVSDTQIECDAGLSLRELTEHALRRGLGGLEFAYGIPGTAGGAVCMNAGAYGGEMKDVVVLTGYLDYNGGAGEFAHAEHGFSYRHSAYQSGGLIVTRVRVSLTPADQSGIRIKMDDFLNRRREKQPLDLPSAGSTFKRPAGNYASALIDSCGLKGFSVGGAAVSEKHAGFVVNKGGATCRDILELIETVRKEVLLKTGYELECEVRYISNKP